MVVFNDVKKEDVAKLVKKGFSKEKVKTIYEEARLTKNGVTIILYTSGKLLVQGSKENLEKVAKTINKLKLGEEIKSEKFRRESGDIIGSDETLKGDTFGGLVVAAVKADKKIRDKLLELGVADSKKLSDREIILMAEKIKRLVPCEIKSILPEEYNKHNKKENITILLDKLHKECADYLKPGKHVVDKYPGCNVGDIMEEKAESKYIEVAAASVLARAAGLKQLNYLGMQAGFNIPKGSTHVALALHELKERGLPFEKFVKVSFGNVENFLKE